MGTGGSYPEI